jgi:hypothetical protein
VQLVLHWLRLLLILRLLHLGLYQLLLRLLVLHWWLVLRLLWLNSWPAYSNARYLPAAKERGRRKQLHGLTCPGLGFIPQPA